MYLCQVSHVSVLRGVDEQLTDKTRMKGKPEENLSHTFELNTVTEEELRRMRSRQRQKETDKVEIKTKFETLVILTFSPHTVLMFFRVTFGCRFSVSSPCWPYSSSQACRGQPIHLRLGETEAGGHSVINNR